MTTRNEMLALIGTFTGEPPLVREIAARIVLPDEEPDLDEDDLDDDEADEALMDALRARWPEATDEEITRGFNLAVAVAKAMPPAPPISETETEYQAWLDEIDASMR